MIHLSLPKVETTELTQYSKINTKIIYKVKKLLLSLIFISIAVSMSAQDNKDAKNYKVASIGFYNLENFYDTVDDTTKNDNDFLPNGLRLYNDSTFRDKCHHLAEAISKCAVETSPDGLSLFGVAEIENRYVLEELAKEPAIASRNYKVVHYDSPDRRGVDVGLMYNPKYFTPLYSRPINVSRIYNGDANRATRDILYVMGTLDGDTIHVMVNHWPSRVGGEAASAPLREGVAKICKTLADSILSINIKSKIFIMGDLNDDPSNESCSKYIGAKKKKEEVFPGGFYNPMWKYYDNGIGTMAYQDAWGLFDQIMISHGTLDKSSKGYHYFKTRIFNESFLTSKVGRYKGYPHRTYTGDTYDAGYSDHFPVYMFLVKEIGK